MGKQQAVMLALVLIVVAGVLVAKTLGGSNVETSSPEPTVAAQPPALVAQAEPASPAPDQAATSSSEAAGGRPLPSLLELGSVGCKACQQMEPIIEALTEELKGKISVEFHDVIKDADMARKYDLTTIPTQVFLDADGRELFRHVGAIEKADILSKLKELGMLKE